MQRAVKDPLILIHGGNVYASFVDVRIIKTNILWGDQKKKRRIHTKIKSLV